MQSHSRRESRRGFNIRGPEPAPAVLFEAAFEKPSAETDQLVLFVTKALGSMFENAGLELSMLPSTDVLRSSVPRPIGWVLDNWNLFASDLSRVERLAIEGPEMDHALQPSFQITWDHGVYAESVYCSLKVLIRLQSIRHSQLSNLSRIIFQMMIEAAGVRGCYAADWVVLPTVSGYCSDPAMYVHSSELVRRDLAWSAANESRRHYVRRIAWFTLLTEHHLKKLGGIDNFLSIHKEISSAGWRRVQRRSELYLTPVGQSVVVQNGSCDASTIDCIRDQLSFHEYVGADVWWECLLLSKGMLLGSDMHSLAFEAHEFSRAAYASLSDGSLHQVRVGHSTSSTPVSREYLRTTPPTFLRRRCLPGTFKDFPSSEFDNRIIWRIARPGESHAFEVWGSPTEYDLLFQSPVYIGAKQRDRAIVVADATRVGYDAELGHDKPTRRKPIRQLRCPRCWCEKFRLAVSLECDISREEAEDLGKRPEDLFTWLSLHAWCTNCKWHKTILDEECA
jgi:hypothetical protein